MEERKRVIAYVSYGNVMCEKDGEDYLRQQIRELGSYCVDHELEIAGYKCDRGNARGENRWALASLLKKDKRGEYPAADCDILVLNKGVVHPRLSVFRAYKKAFWGTGRKLLCAENDDTISVENRNYNADTETYYSLTKNLTRTLRHMYAYERAFDGLSPHDTNEKCRFGYKRVSRGVVEFGSGLEQQAVSDIFRMYDDGFSLPDIAEIVNAKYLRESDHKQLTNRDVLLITQDEAFYCGYIAFEDMAYCVKGQHAPLLPMRQFDPGTRTKDGMYIADTRKVMYRHDGYKYCDMSNKADLARAEASQYPENIPL